MSDYMDPLTVLVNDVARVPLETIQAILNRPRCGHQNDDGTLCRYPKTGTRNTCPKHSEYAKKLNERRRKVARAFAANDPDAFTKQRKAAGRLGFEKTGRMYGFERACHFARLRRKEHPSLCEKWAMSIFAELGISFLHQEAIEGDELHAVDFVIGNLIVEVNHPNPEKRTWLEARGFIVLVIEVTEMDVTSQTPRAMEAQQQVLAFLESNPPPDPELPRTA